MYVLIIIIYIILLSIIEIFSVFFQKKKIQLIELCDKLPNNVKLTEINDKANKNIDNYLGYFSLNNNYGFYVKDDIWNVLKHKIYYKFNVPVNIKLITIDKNLHYFKE